MDNDPQSTEIQDQVHFTVNAETFAWFCELLDAPPKDNPGLARLMAMTPSWKTPPETEGPPS